MTELQLCQTKNYHRIVMSLCLALNTKLLFSLFVGTVETGMTSWVTFTCIIFASCIYSEPRAAGFRHAF